MPAVEGIGRKPKQAYCESELRRQNKPSWILSLWLLNVTIQGDGNYIIPINLLEKEKKKAGQTKSKKKQKQHDRKKQYPKQPAVVVPSQKSPLLPISPPTTPPPFLATPPQNPPMITPYHSKNLFLHNNNNAVAFFSVSQTPLPSSPPPSTAIPARPPPLPTPLRQQDSASSSCVGICCIQTRKNFLLELLLSSPPTKSKNGPQIIDKPIVNLEQKELLKKLLIKLNIRKRFRECFEIDVVKTTAINTKIFYQRI